MQYLPNPKNYFIGLAIVFSHLSIAQGQEQQLVNTARKYLQENRDNWALSTEDVVEIKLTDSYRSRHNGVMHCYFMQTFRGIEIYNAVAGVHLLPDGSVGYATNQFQRNIKNRINRTNPLIEPTDAILRAARHLQVPVTDRPVFITKTNEGLLKYSGGSISQHEIFVSLTYFPSHTDELLLLAWQLDIAPLESPDHWSLRVDAVTGEVLDKTNWTTHCQLDVSAGGATTSKRAVIHSPQPPPDTSADIAARYHVFPIPVESPLHGERTVVVDPSDPIASPFGWHDIDMDGINDYTITRGNYTHAHLDIGGNDVSKNDEPDGQDSLYFDFPYLPNFEPDSNRDAAVTQAFYMTNIMHDFAYHYGFDEAAGNFQVNNNENGGVGKDAVQVHVQDGSGLNNANFACPPDGREGRMQLFLWEGAGNKLMEILEPVPLQGLYKTGTANYGPAISEDKVEGYIVEAFDASNSPDKACEAISNAEDVNGKIAMVNRGLCFFEQKTVNVEAAGAIALIICNFEENTVGMSGVDNVPNPSIPTISLKDSDCQRIRMALHEGVKAKLQIPEVTGPERLDAAFDNGIIAHEFGHGISIRLTGGPANSNCLVNDEQMGEGWSDFFALALTAKPGDQGDYARGIGNYVTRSDTQGTGIRRYPYSTASSVNSQTYEDIVGTTSPHQLGEIWASVLWDLYWKMVDVYGWDDDLYYGNGGNNLAIQLVMDGMKYQPCNPGFIDGRDALLKADSINNGGANACLIWEVFANRGLGWSAKQNDSADRNDGFEAKDVRPECLKTLKIDKQVSSVINAGDSILVRIAITNHKDSTATDVVVTDLLPAGTQFLPGSLDGVRDYSLEENTLSFELGNLPNGEEKVISYALSTDRNILSRRYFYDDMENGEGDWLIDALAGTAIWQQTDSLASSGTKSWWVPVTQFENDQVLVLWRPFTPEGSQPVLRFAQYLKTEPGEDGGIIEVSTDGGFNWELIPEEAIFRNGYTGPLDYHTFSIPNLRAYWGTSDGFIDSYIDLAAYRDQEILVRFRFGTDEEQDPAPAKSGWYIDDVELLDLRNYLSEACVTSDQGDQACSLPASRGTLVTTGQIATTTETADLQHLAMKLSPNPVHHLISVKVQNTQASHATFDIVTIEGRAIQHYFRFIPAGTSILELDASRLPAGIYTIRLHAEGRSVVKKFVKVD